MKPRTKRNLATAAGLGIGLAGVGVLIFSLIWKPGNKEMADHQRPAAMPQDKGPDDSTNLAELGPLLKLRLQRPLVDPKVEMVVKPKKDPVASWPRFKLSCIFVGSKSKLAVFEQGNTSHTCAVGDAFSNVEVLKINDNSVEVEFRGKSRLVELPVGEKVSN